MKPNPKLHTALVDLKNRIADNFKDVLINAGICDNISDFAYAEIQIYAVRWPEFSGDTMFAIRFILSFVVLSALTGLLALAGGTPGPWTPWVLIAAALLITYVTRPEEKK